MTTIPVGGIHGPQDYDTNVEIEHWQTCIANIKISILEGTVGLSHLHEALDLADRTARSRKPRATRKRVRFSPHPTAGISGGRISYFAADLHYTGMAPESRRVAYYCADRRCGCKVNELFRNEDEHDEQVKLRARARAKRSAEASCSDSSSVSEAKGKSGSDTKSKGIRTIFFPGSKEQKRKRGEGSPPMRKRKLARKKGHRGCMYL